MPNTTSAKKAMRQDKKRRLINISRLNRVRTFIKKAEKCIDQAAKDRSEDSVKKSSEAIRLMESALMKASNRRIISKKAASRKTSRLSARLKKLQAAS